MNSLRDALESAGYAQFVDQDILERRNPWSATLTPFLEDDQLGSISVGRSMDWHIACDIAGMVCGTCGEGPWIPERPKNFLVGETVSPDLV